MQPDTGFGDVVTLLRMLACGFLFMRRFQLATAESRLVRLL